ncbi:molybdopterin-dependent oxidoreductase [Epidermidibacterium keratini]|uniref:Molybdopterin-dependent oxidoreductase n=1 Tax=Epidermidibacterium keratini TaxID=1891644 RepID=A0A7L4YHS6_9ACTN|nr:xanthine dehydrogenase family protein molybdopterin-binding subunit [Epidermidibacterium keratini]QHB98867.1 molybdopterin-dependent oxidoreductase [Epidermidibacterium keratini]
MAGSILGNEVLRVEDPEIVLGRGIYTGDLKPEGLLYVAFARSTIAHGDILSVDTSEAEGMPGVVKVYTADNLDVEPFQMVFAVADPLNRPPLAQGRVRFVGEAVAAVVAETPEQAVDAAEAIFADIDFLPAVTDIEATTAADAPVINETLGKNVVFGNYDPTDSLDDAEVVVKARLSNQRVAAAPMENQVLMAMPPQNGQPLTVYAASQGVHWVQGMVKSIFGLESDQVRVITPLVGGAFGAKFSLPHEGAVAIKAAMDLGRPVQWVETRSENFTGLPHGRAQVQWVEMGFRKDGTVTGLRCHVLGDGGAYGGFGGTLFSSTKLMSSGVYQIPKISFSAAMVLTNTTPTGAYRGAGRPEATALLERLMDMGAAELGIDPAEIRRKNFIPPEDFPLTTIVGAPYDSGEYAKSLDAALEASGYDELRAEQKARRERGDRVQLGIGVSAYVEVTAGLGGDGEWGSVTVEEDGSATMRVGTASHGQGHATAFAMLVSDQLGIPIEKIRLSHNDTNEVPEGMGTGGSRSLQIGGNAVRAAAVEVLNRAKELAATKLEANADDIVVTDDGALGVTGVPGSTVSWTELAALARENGGQPLEYAGKWAGPGPSFPFGAHVSVVEVDLDTGQVTPRRHIAVDDCGTILNPLLVRGQQHGGIAQGLAQSLFEEVVYDEDGNPVTMALSDYGVPSAVDLCDFTALNTETPAPGNPIGAKGIGESGTIGATPAVHSAVIDALAHLGVRHIDMPCTPEKVWRAVQAAESGQQPEIWSDPPAMFRDLPEGRATDAPDPDAPQA